MAYRTVTGVSWFSRLKNSIFGIFLGALLILAMVVLVFWNEGRAVTTARSLAEGAGIVVSVDAASVDPAREGMLVHVSGPVTAQARASDPEFAIEVDALRLIRTAEMYQWREAKRTESEIEAGGAEETITTYSYDKGWEKRAVASERFAEPGGHENPSMQVSSRNFPVPEAHLGAFTLDPRVIGMIGGARPHPIAIDLVDRIQAAVGAGMRAHVADGRIYLGSDPREPRIGDYRIGYQIVPLGPVSIVGAQAGSGFAPYQTEAGDRLLMAQAGDAAAAEMFDHAVSANAVLTWVLRVVGLVFLVVGFSMLLRPLGVIGDVVPFLGSLVRAGTGIVAAVAGVLVGSVTIALAWFLYRPLTALIILAIGAAVAYALARYARGKAAARGELPPAQEPPVQPA